MFGLLSQNGNYYLNEIEQYQEFGFDAGRLSFGGGGGTGISPSGVASTPSLVGSNTPTQQFDISVLSGLKDTDKYLGKNRVKDIKETYDTYLTGNPIGRGGQYAVDAARKYGTTITEAARGYLVAAGLPTLAQIISPTSTVVTTPDTKDEEFFPLPVKDEVTTESTKNPFELLIDAFQRSFGNAVYNPPLQSQSSGFTGVDQGVPLAEGIGGNIGTYIVIGVIGVIAYFLYKRFAS